MADDQPQPEGKRLAAVLSDTSLEHLAREVAERWMHMALYLSLSNTALVHMHLDGTDGGRSDLDQARSMLQRWKSGRETAKDRDKVADLERALREMNKADVADILADRHRDNMELTSDCFN